MWWVLYMRSVYLAYLETVLFMYDLYSNASRCASLLILVWRILMYKSCYQMVQNIAGCWQGICCIFSMLRNILCICECFSDALKCPQSMIFDWTYCNMNRTFKCLPVICHVGVNHNIRHLECFENLRALWHISLSFKVSPLDIWQCIQIPAVALQCSPAFSHQILKALWNACQHSATLTYRFILDNF